jgi:hypothetical protein
VDPELIFGIEIVAAIISFTLVARWYVAPRLDALPVVEGLTPLLLLHTYRTLGLMMIVPSVVDPTLPDAFAVPAAYGDFLAAILAFATLGAFRMRLAIAPLLAWAFSVEGIGDLLNAFVQGFIVGITDYQLGATWFIFTVLVPALLVSHVMIVVRLLRRSEMASWRSQASS